MGIFGSKSYRQATRAETLEELEIGIQRKETDQRQNVRNQKIVIRNLFLFAVGLFAVIFMLYMFLLVDYWLLLAPPVGYFLSRRGIRRHYTTKSRENDYEVSKMKEEKRRLLDEVKHKETYMTAKQLLEKYGTPEDRWDTPNWTPKVDSSTEMNRSTDHLITISTA